MVKTKKTVKSNKATGSKKTTTFKSSVKKKKVAVKKKAVRTVIKKKAVKTVIKKKAVRTAIKKKAVKTVVNKKAAKPSLKKTALKNKRVVKSSGSTSQANILRATIAALKDELKSLKNDLKIAGLREVAVSNLINRRDTAIEKFLSSWDKQAKSALEKSLKPKKMKKSKK